MKMENIFKHFCPKKVEGKTELFYLKGDVAVPGLEDRVYQERYKMVIAPKSESCIFIEQLEVDWTLSISYVVTSSKNGAQMDITLRLRDPDKRMVTYQGRRKQGNFSDYKVKTGGDHEVCWNNRHSMIDSKRLVWEYDIQVALEYSSLVKCLRGTRSGSC